jgi:hypothetical protein
VSREVVIKFTVSFPEDAFYDSDDKEMYEYALRHLARSFFDAEGDIRAAMANDRWGAEWSWREADRYTYEELDRTPPQPPAVLTTSAVQSAVQKLRQQSYAQMYQPAVIGADLSHLIGHNMSVYLDQYSAAVEREAPPVFDPNRIGELLAEKKGKTYPGKTVKFNRKGSK